MSATTTPSTSTTTTMMGSTMAQITQAANGQLVVSAPSSAFGDLGGASIVFSSSSSHPPTHLLILKRHPGDSLHQDAGLIQFESTSPQQQSAPTLTSVAMSYGGPFRCDRCSEGFRSRKALNNHCASVHSVSRFTSVYPCSHCNSLFRLQSDLETHLRTQHSKPQLITLFHSGGSNVSSGANGDNLIYAGPSFSSSSSSSGCSSVASTSSNFSQMLPDHPMLIKQVHLQSLIIFNCIVLRYV